MTPKKIEEIVKRAGDPNFLFKMYEEASTFESTRSIHLPRAKEAYYLGIVDYFNPIDSFVFRECRDQFNKSEREYLHCAIPNFQMFYDFRSLRLRKLAGLEPSPSELLKNSLVRAAVYTYASYDSDLRHALEFNDPDVGLWRMVHIILNPLNIFQ